MCRAYTFRAKRALRAALPAAFAAAALYAPVAPAQTPAIDQPSQGQASQGQASQGQPSQKVSAWHRIGTTTIAEGLAGPASGAVTDVWYRGAATLARTSSGRVFETTDREGGNAIHWRLNTSGIPSASGIPLGREPAAQATALPESGARVVGSGRRLYAAGRNFLYRSEDGGASWLNLTAVNAAGYANSSILGGALESVAVAPDNPDEVTAATSAGVWRSLDGGLSWRSLNGELPNLPVRKLIDRRTLLLETGISAQLAGGNWVAADAEDGETALRKKFSESVRSEVAAAVQTSALAYAGTADGRLLASRDGGATWAAAQNSGGPISRIWVDAARPETALAASGATLWRTVNGGLFWDAVTAVPGGTQIHGVTADTAAGVVYVATERGIYAGDISLRDAGRATTEWQTVSRDLPAAAAWDVLLNPDGTLTAALDGYGVYETAAPHQPRSVRVVSGADLTDRPAAPGSLISVLGAKIERVQGAGTSYPVLAAADQSSQVQVPFNSVAGTYQLVLEGSSRDGAARWTVPLTVKDSAPAIFVDAEGAPLLLDAASGLVMDPGVAIRASNTVQLLATGLGRVTPDWPAGIPAPLDSPPRVAGSVQAYLDGIPVEVTSATLAPGYTGYYIVGLRIPAIVNRGASELRIVMNGEQSNRVKVYLEPELAPLQ